MKISSITEQIFSHAVALDQSGNMRNTIYATGKEVFILNYDNTILLRFRLRPSEINFQNPISFRANDYDSNEFYEENGKIVFLSGKGDYRRKKSCSVPDLAPDSVKELFESFPKPNGFSMTFDKGILSLLEDNLSHMEFVGEKDKELQLIQRNIYSGAIVEVQRSGKGLISDSKLPFNLGPLALRTNDFQAMFAFQNSLKFTFPNPEDDNSGDYVRVDSTDKKKQNMTGLISCCLYDEIINIKEAHNGRQK